MKDSERAFKIILINELSLKIAGASGLSILSISDAESKIFFETKFPIHDLFVNLSKVYKGLEGYF